LIRPYVGVFWAQCRGGDRGSAPDPDYAECLEKVELHAHDRDLSAIDPEKAGGPPLDQGLPASTRYRAAFCRRVRPGVGGHARARATRGMSHCLAIRLSGRIDLAAPRPYFSAVLDVIVLRCTNRDAVAALRLLRRAVHT
jgi:hypothetical protein